MELNQPTWNQPVSDSYTQQMIGNMQAIVNVTNTAFAKITEASLGNNIHFINGNRGIGLKDTSVYNFLDMVSNDTSVYIKTGVSSWIQFAIRNVSLG